MQELRAGDSGPIVSLVQHRLDLLGFGPLEQTGIFDEATAAAATALQSARGLTVSGEVDERTWVELLGAEYGANTAVSPGYLGDGDDDFQVVQAGGTGPTLTDIQLRLRLMGFDLPLEENLGPATEAALRQVQAEHLLPVTGALDFDTFTVIQGETGGHQTVWDEAAPDADLVDQAVGPMSFAAGASRDIASKGGYRYRQWEDGEVEILASPTGRGVGARFYEGKVWEAITNEIGRFPAALDTGPAGADTPAAPAGTVQRGLNGDDARKVQARLSELGFGPLTADGIFGKGSEAALKRFQESVGLPANGVCDPKTWDRLDDPWPVFQVGAQGDAVKALQQRLSAHGFKTEPTGIFGAETQTAVVGFQKQVGLPATGQLDPRTQGHLYGQQPRALPDAAVSELRNNLLAKLPDLVAAHPSAVRDTIASVIRAAINTVGLREIPKGSNGGPEMGFITEGFAGNAPPWCALAVSYWVKTGLGVTDWKLLPWGCRNARALSFGQWGESKGRLIASHQKAPAGAIYVMLREGSGSDAGGARASGAAKWQGNGHTGLVIEDGGDSIVTIDGNVSDMIKVCTRKKSDVIGYVTWW